MASHKESIDIWLAFYKARTGQTYILDGKQCSHLKQLIKKVSIKVSEKGMDPNDENVLNSFRALLFSINDKWVLDNLDVSIVNSKFNVIYTNAVKTNPFTAASRIDDLVDLRNSQRTKQGGGY